MTTRGTAAASTREVVTIEKIDAKGLPFRDLNERLHQAAAGGADQVELVNVNGQRYIGTGLTRPIKINIYGTPGSDMGAFMDGPDIEVFGSGQDAVGNTMNTGRIIIHGDAGNVLGLAMRGGAIMVRGSVGYRVGIHIKAFRDRVPVIVVGGVAGDFLGEYMAGGRVIVLGLGRQPGQPLVGDYLGTGMHGGAIYVRGPVDPHNLGQEVREVEMTRDDLKTLRSDLAGFCRAFGMSSGEIMKEPFTKLIPTSHRPYGRLYVY